MEMGRRDGVHRKFQKTIDIGRLGLFRNLAVGAMSIKEESVVYIAGGLHLVLNIPGLTYPDTFAILRLTDGN